MSARSGDRVSVVIPSYNRADLLQHTVDSILRQTIAPAEIIVVDDGSTDDTQRICAGFPTIVKCLRQNNQGLPAARNTGIRASTGDWIAFCDSDDLWAENKLEIQLAALSNTGCGWSVSDFSLIDPDGALLHDGEGGFERIFPVLKKMRLSARDHLGQWLRSGSINTPAGPVEIFHGDAFGMFFLGNVALPSSALVSRAIIEKAGLFDVTFRVAEETEFFHRVAAVSPLVVVMSALTRYRIGHPSIVRTNSALLSENALRSIERAATLRAQLTPRERKAFESGRRYLRVRLAYARLAALDPAGARDALMAQSGAAFSLGGVAILIASFFPRELLSMLHELKRKLRSIRG
ncbi:MAG TPA: glycosyltransferase family 2 protein [Gemmatimonadaceae bacterium]